MKRHQTRTAVAGRLAVATTTATLLAGALAQDPVDWKSNTISPVANPIFFESPFIQSEVRPLFIQHHIPDDFLAKELGLSQGAGGVARVYALQLRYAVNDRLAIIATKDGFIELEPDQVLAKDQGWADVAAGLKYAIIDDPARQFILTPGLTFEFPVGEESVFQGNGWGEWNLFVSGAKGWGNLHLTANAGVRLPNDWDEETSSLHYSIQLDYYTCRWFIPFFVMNGFTVLSDADQLPLETEGYDLINFGSSDASGWTGLLVGGGFRSRLHQRVDIGFAYEVAVNSPEGLFDDRYTIDLIWRY